MKCLKPVFSGLFLSFLVFAGCEGGNAGLLEVPGTPEAPNSPGDVGLDAAMAPSDVATLDDVRDAAESEPDLDVGEADPDPQPPELPQPLVAIHISELTAELETLAVEPGDLEGPGETGFQWRSQSWRYHVAHESLQEAFRADGTPFATLSDADISDGGLTLPGGEVRYPLVISLMAEAVADDALDALREYVEAGGFLLVGGSSFTRRPGGGLRDDFGLAQEMGLHTVRPGFESWGQNTSFSRVTDHRLVSHIPTGVLNWRMPLHANEVPMGIWPDHVVHNRHLTLEVISDGAEVIAVGDHGPLLTTRRYGTGRFIYHGAFQPLIGHGGFGSGMYAYLIIRNAVEWAFEAFEAPIIKVSPWPYPHNAAFVIRHDFENSPGSIRSIKASAQAEHEAGARGDYYFCTGTLRVSSGDQGIPETDKPQVISEVQEAVRDFGATVGSHNGGLPNPVNPNLPPGQYNYWHWGPDEAIDVNPDGLMDHEDGAAYALASIDMSFEDIEGWLEGLDNGRQGCGALDNCPRTFTSPYFNATREASYEILEETGSIIMGAQKIGPFPHWTVSYQVPAKRFSHLTLPPSDWYIGNRVAQSMEMGHSEPTVRALVDFYYDLGALINLYSHASSAGGVAREYLMAGVGKAQAWATNAVEIHDWWTERSGVQIVPRWNTEGRTIIAGATITGATDPDTAIELVLPKLPPEGEGDIEVLLDGLPAETGSYRRIPSGVKIRVGTRVSDAELRYRPMDTWTQTDWEGGPDQDLWADETRFQTASGVEDEGGELTLQLATGGETLFSDSFDRASPTPWREYQGAWTITEGVLQAQSNLRQYSIAHLDEIWDDHALEARLRFGGGAFGGGIGGRVDPETGARYAAWIYPRGSQGGTNVLKLVKFRTWTTWRQTPMQEVVLPEVGEGWHTLRMALQGARVRVYFDDVLVVDHVDMGFDDRPAYLRGGVSVEAWTQSSDQSISIEADEVRVLTPRQHLPQGTLLSSAFHGGAGVVWKTVSWDADVPASSSLRVRTRTADRSDALPTSPWSEWLTQSGASVSSRDLGWLQYEVELSSTDPGETPRFFEITTHHLAPGQ